MPHLKKIAVGCCISAFTITTFSCSQNKNTTEENAPEYLVQTLDTSTVTVYKEFSTTIQSQDVIEIRPRITGYVDKIIKQEGAHVKKGELIFQIADADYRQQVNAAQAGIQASEAQLSNATLEVEKLTPLVAKGIISPFELKSAKSKLEAVKAQLVQSKAEYENSLINLSYTRITSPVDGLLGVIPIRVGSLVSASSQEPLTTVSGLGDISAYFSIDEKLVMELRKVPETINKDAGYVDLILADGTQYSQKGRLMNASGIIDRATGSIQVKVIFPNPNTEILSGSSGVLRFPTLYKGAIAIPQSATYEMQDKIMTYIVGDDNVVKSTSIEVIGKTADKYVVKNLQTGDKVVVGGVAKLRDGQTIKPKLN